MLGALTRGRSETEQKAIVAVAAGTTLALVAMRQRAIRSAIASMLTVRVMKFVCVCVRTTRVCVATRVGRASGRGIGCDYARLPRRSIADGRADATGGVVDGIGIGG